MRAFSDIAACQASDLHAAQRPPAEAHQLVTVTGTEDATFGTANASP